MARAPCCLLLPTHSDQGNYTTDRTDRVSNVEYLQNIQAIKPVPDSNVSDFAELHFRYSLIISGKSVMCSFENFVFSELKGQFIHF